MSLLSSRRTPCLLQASQPHLEPWKCDGTAHSENHFQAQEGKKSSGVVIMDPPSAWSCLTILINFCNEITSLMGE